MPLSTATTKSYPIIILSLVWKDLILQINTMIGHSIRKSAATWPMANREFIPVKASTNTLEK
ncbi:MAG: hypothetical protein BVN35_02225 [Proteobacteria bacterium ST_bin11]|nr:MAG: hypothetical protein BVN35_02225 [Proteobacteria bacterium ST_bin11]